LGKQSGDRVGRPFPNFITFDRMRQIFLFFGLTMWFLLGEAQLYVGPNIGPAWGRTGDLQFYYYPHNEYWIAASVSAGYTYFGRTYFPRRSAECLDHLRSGGWHVRVGARNDLTTKNHGSHPYWELLAVYTRQKESAIIGACDTSMSLTRREQVGTVISGALRLGYTWNPFERKTIYQRFLLDFGLQIGVPIWSSHGFLAERNYYSGIGLTYFPIRSVALEPTITLRYRVGTRRYGFHKGKTRSRFHRRNKEPDPKQVR